MYTAGWSPAHRFAFGYTHMQLRLLFLSFSVTFFLSFYSTSIALALKHGFSLFSLLFGSVFGLNHLLTPSNTLLLSLRYLAV